MYTRETGSIARGDEETLLKFERFYGLTRNLNGG